MEQCLYKASLTSEPFLYQEIKVITELKKKWYSNDSIKDDVINHNLFQYKTIKSSYKRLSVVVRRLSYLDDFLIDILLNWDIDSSKLINTYCIYKDNLLFRDFVDMFLYNKFVVNDYKISGIEVLNFLNNQAFMHPEINKWTESTLLKIKQILIKILHSAGLINDKKNTLQKIVANRGLFNYLNDIWEKWFVRSVCM